MKINRKKFQIFWVIWMIVSLIVWYRLVPDAWKAESGLDDPFLNSVMYWVIVLLPAVLRCEILYIIPGIKQNFIEFMQMGKTEEERREKNEEDEK